MKKQGQQTNDKKLAALCFFMEGQCHANYTYYVQLANKAPGASLNYARNYLAVRQKGGNADYYKQIVDECETY